MSDVQGEPGPDGAAEETVAGGGPADPAAVVDALEQRIIVEQGNPVDSPEAQPTEEPLAEPPV